MRFFFCFFFFFVGYIKFDRSWRFYNKSIENLIGPQGRVTEVTDPIRPEFELVRDFMPVQLVTSNLRKIQSKK